MRNWLIVGIFCLSSLHATPARTDKMNALMALVQELRSLQGTADTFRFRAIEVSENELAPGTSFSESMRWLQENAGKSSAQYALSGDALEFREQVLRQHGDLHSAFLAIARTSHYARPAWAQSWETRLVSDPAQWIEPEILHISAAARTTYRLDDLLEEMNIAMSHAPRLNIGRSNELLPSLADTTLSHISRKFLTEEGRAEILADSLAGPWNEAQWKQIVNLLDQSVRLYDTPFHVAELDGALIDAMVLQPSIPALVWGALDTLSFMASNHVQTLVDRLAQGPGAYLSMEQVLALAGREYSRRSFAELCRNKWMLPRELWKQKNAAELIKKIGVENAAKIFENRSLHPIPVRSLLNELGDPIVGELWAQVLSQVHPVFVGWNAILPLVNAPGLAGQRALGIIEQFARRSSIPPPPAFWRLCEDAFDDTTDTLPPLFKALEKAMVPVLRDAISDFVLRCDPKIQLRILRHTNLPSSGEPPWWKAVLHLRAGGSDLVRGEAAVLIVRKQKAGLSRPPAQRHRWPGAVELLQQVCRFFSGS